MTRYITTQWQGVSLSMDWVYCYAVVGCIGTQSLDVSLPSNLVYFYPVAGCSITQKWGIP